MAAEQHPTGIVTPEAVVLAFETAGVGSRAVAKMLDLLAQAAVLLGVVLAIVFATGFGGVSNSILIAIVLVVVLFLVIFGYPVIIEMVWNGKTLGKAALGLRAMTREGAPLRFRHAALRGIIGIIEVYIFPFLAVLSCAISRENQRFGDMAGGTIVIRERKAAAQSTAVTFRPPPGLEGYVYGLDVSGLTSERYQLVRSFLIRAQDLNLSSRMALAVRLANPIAVELKHDPPPMINPELFLVCVASAYQVRHGGPAAAWAPTGPGYPPVGYPPVGYPPVGYPPVGYPPVGYPPALVPRDPRPAPPPPDPWNP